jgi:hypothetical protein
MENRLPSKVAGPSPVLAGASGADEPHATTVTAPSCRQQKVEADQNAATEKDRTRLAALKAKSDTARQPLDKRNAQVDEVNEKIGDVAKAAQGK